MKTFTKFQKDVQKLAKRWSTTTDPTDDVLNQTWGMNKIDDFYKKLQDREGKKGAKKKAKIAYFPFKPQRPSTKFPVPWEGV